jgi:hypothetical protein
MFLPCPAIAKPDLFDGGVGLKVIDMPVGVFCGAKVMR